MIYNTWIAKLKDGREVTGSKTEWSEIKGQVEELSIELNTNPTITLPKGMDEYIQAKTASANLDGSGVRIESRYIGFKSGNNTVRVRVNEKTNNINIEID